MARWPYRKGVQDLGRGSFAYLQPDGSWGLSNAGLVTDGEASLLVDTLFDLRLTREMLDAFRDASPAAARIGTVVNTHANGDHCYGNSLVAEARIVATKAAAEEMRELPPQAMAAFLENADALGRAGEMFRRGFGRFEFAGIEPVLPTETFEGEISLRVGDKRVDVIEVGPAHTRGDAIVHVPSDRVAFTGDILFIDDTPILWQGPVANWIRACDRILAFDCETVVPGHGPLTDAAGVRAVRDYLVFLREETRRRFDAGLPAAEAARDLAAEVLRSPFGRWRDAERIVVNVHTVYRELHREAGTPPPETNLLALFEQMADLAG